jgi:hypothetical protein
MRPGPVLPLLLLGPLLSALPAMELAAAPGSTRGGGTVRQDGARFTVTLSNPGAEVDLVPAAGTWAVGDDQAVLLAVRNPGTTTVAIRGVLDGNGWIDGLAVVPPATTRNLEILLKRPKVDDARDRQFSGMYGRPGGRVWLWTGVTADHLRRLTLSAVGAAPGTTVEIRSLSTRSLPSVSDAALAPGGGFFPFVDAFGQYRHAEWPGKLTQEAELKTRHAAEERDLAVHPAPADRDRFGGWARGPQLAATGHFRTEKIHDRWWLVDPDGHLFWSQGITCVGGGAASPAANRAEWFTLRSAPGGLGAALTRGEYLDFLSANRWRTFGDGWEATSRDLALRRLASWGCNTLGNWSEASICHLGRMPYVLPIWYGGPRLTGNFPDVRQPGFEQALRGALAAAAWAAKDPWCIGYFIDNELEWPATDRAELAERYYATCALLMHDLAPQKLYLGSRLHDHLSPFGGDETVVRAAARHCAVISVNRYRFGVDDLRLPVGVDKPLMIGEFHIGALDRGLLHPGLRSVADQEQRAGAYTVFMTSALRHPAVIGAHWFQYADQPLTGRGDGENYQIGFLDVTDTPYPELVNAARMIGSQLYQLHDQP